MSSSLPKSESTTSLIGSSAHRQHQHPKHHRSQEPAEGARGSSRTGCARRGQRSQHEEDTARRKPPSHQPQSEKSPRRSDETSSFFEPKNKPRRGSNQSVNANPASACAEATGKHGSAHAKAPDEELRPIVKSVFGQVGIHGFYTRVMENVEMMTSVLNRFVRLRGHARGPI